ncbi:caspase family protein [Massilia sp. PAMC28688]|uniref:YDG domain-containing protein n=1 Tax=Massilia sp. PAMC28688 TaxID=2861283 RepID=UPI001C62D13E|nr:YDG domain-containing protein [Massilia sp. PAMC28688]QYF95718.1 caspase family protein [Massilia sp. PAMC28688]
MKLPSQHRPHSSPRRTRHARRALVASLIAAFGGAAAPAWAQLPTGLQVVSGTAPAVIDGSQLTITNSPNAVLNWESFSIGANNGVRFEQESASSKVLNRVVGNDPSSILGSLTSNGEVWLVNPHGVLFGSSARVDVGAMVASTLGIANEDFINNRFSFATSGSSAGQVLNRGTITTSFGGRLWLLGDAVRNEGAIESETGKIVLAAGKSIELVDSGAPNVTVRVSAPENTTVNLGSLLAPEGGSIDLHGASVNQDGIVRADSMDYDNVGRIVIRASGDIGLGAGSQTSVNSTTYLGGRLLVDSRDGTTTVAGTVSADNSGDIGGSVHLLGQQVNIDSTAGISANGWTGGEVLVGGSAGGADAAIHHALNTYIAPSASISASATDMNGNGGTIVVWSGGSTRVFGTLEARGGLETGDGGVIETSGLVLEGNPLVDVTRGGGRPGSWLLGAGGITARSNGSGNSDPAPFIATEALSYALARGAGVTLRAGGHGSGVQSGNIVLGSEVANISQGSFRADSGASLNLEAHNDITVNAGAGMTVDTSAIRVSLTADSDGDGAGGINLREGARFITRGGYLLLGGGAGEYGSAQHITIAGSTLNTAGGMLAMTAGSVDLSGASTVDGGDIAFEADSVRLDNAVVRADSSEGLSMISISAAAVALNAASLDATDYVNVLAPTSFALNNSTISAGAEGGALDMSTGSLTSTGSMLATPNGYWVMRLAAGQTAFPASALEQLGYTYVQVGAGVDATPLRSGIGQHGVLMADAVHAQVRVDASREYDGTSAASFSRWVGQSGLPEGLVLSPDHGNVVMETSFQDKNAGVDKAIVYDYDSPAFAVVTAIDLPVFGVTQSYVADITRKALSAQLVAANKTYDATRTASLSGSLSGMIDGDSVALGSASGLFDSKHVGLGKTVTFSSATLTGADAANYTLTGAAAMQADITPRPMGANGLSAANKVYDGSRSAALSGALADVLGGDTVWLDGATGLFDSKDVGAARPVTITGTLAGADAGNYALAPSLVVNADITHRPLAIAIAGEVRKEYDATLLASVGAGQFRLDGVLAGESLSVTGPAQGSFDSRHAGQFKQVTATGTFTIDGAQASNYRIGDVYLGASSNLVTASASGNVGTITPRPVSATVTAANKVYDATRAATLTGSLSGVLGGDMVSFSGATGLFDTKHAGSAKTVTIAGATLSGADAGNYTLASPATTHADITPRAVGVNLSVAARVYDGSRDAALSASLADALAGDLLALEGVSGQFDTRDAGLSKNVTVSGGTLTGADAANYVLSMPAATSGDVMHRPLEIGLTGSVSKEYDATTDATLAPGQFLLGGLVAGDRVTVAGPSAGSFDSANVGQQKQVSVSGSFDIGGADAANYRVGNVILSNASTLVSASARGNVGTITPATLLYQATPAERSAGTTPGGFTGTVTGWKGSDQLAGAASGTLAWTSPATASSAPGSYAIEGSGLVAANYVFAQHPANASALQIRFDGLAAGLPETAAGSSAQASQQAVQAALPVALAPQQAAAVSGAVTGLGTGAPQVAVAITTSSAAVAANSFSPVAIGAMNHNELAHLIDRRKDFKKKLFADAIYKLDIDPRLADVQPCTTIVEASSGACLITRAQLDEIHQAKAHTQADVKSTRPKMASVPQIERKIAVLFGINDYTDKQIPKLENAIPDVDAVARQLADKLGYEVTVVRNPVKADIIRTLNALSTRVDPSDSVVIYYAGHGYSLEKNGAGYWLAADANVNEPASWVSNSDIAQLLTGIRSRQMSLISDSCYSGGFAREGMDAVGQDVKVEEVLAKRSVVVLSSGGDEPVADEGKGGHSIFAWHLMQVVGTIADWKPGSKIFTEVQSRVKKDFPQTPKYGSVSAAGHQPGGDFLFEMRTN